ncbi:type II toxin-antitoxin system HicA family toxin [Xanthomonas perforans]|uniref:type II toxin-antitoxin system HicA family toxin n=1 Tax=Xanthomonas perforans TaxID=442694 RepID=UPI001190BD8F|nr:type II toxin-antitoxin system HicA family toxin [Xanthomonas perforans]MDC9651486.1 type II toxin-antitoxin system HicA family toxin [Xanthomonas perforans]MDC9658313.1 type II toxin-antitoxin system HicA family toxin [Xanthomonas perforans]MDC9679096.1 type II toxin-antitoxin system HicA family toxin [Xanthomonas perforans]MDC9680013.1 type II toxin-antitoxin system HicA family toxin [Xanthomonas perforans]MDC9684228.1 type II toxin-antitoxin system HicA family toxin [Xanthomonas perforan
MTFPGHVWKQLKSASADDLIRALNKDGWVCDMDGGSQRIYLHPTSRKRVSIHYHPQRTYGPKMLQKLLDDIGWTEDEMKNLKLIK